eukprot:scaffold2244_cov363-Pavlova_lutheri.AAC.14
MEFALAEPSLLPPGPMIFVSSAGRTSDHSFDYFIIHELNDARVLYKAHCSSYWLWRCGLDPQS